jgi:prevent-host-death family protein
MKKKTVPRTISALTARAQLGQIMTRASEDNERFLVKRHGEPTVIIMSIRDYVDTIAPAPDWLKKSWSEAKRRGLDKLSLREINMFIARARRKSIETDLTLRAKR